MAETMKKEEMSAAQKELIKAEMSARGVRFLPKQVISRLMDPKSGAQVLGSQRRHKATLEAKRAALAKAPVTMAAKPAGAKPEPAKAVKTATKK